MTNRELQIAIRTRPEIAPRAEKLAAVLANAPEFGAMRMTRATVLHMAMFEGLKVLEERYAHLPPAKRTKPRKRAKPKG